MKTIVHRTLLDLGVSPALKGYEYLTDAIMYQIDKKTACCKMCDVYKIIATNRDVTASSVERAIRHSIETANAKSLNLAWWNQIFRNYIDIQTEKPCNKDFVSIVTQYLLDKEVK